jgi:MFS family permease
MEERSQLLPKDGIFSSAGVFEKRWVVIGLLCVGFFLDNASGAALASSFRALEVEIGLSPLKQGTVLMVQSLTGSICAPLWGYHADRYDRYFVLSAAAGIWAFATMATAFAGTAGLWPLATARFFYGIGSSAVTPVVQSIVADTFQDNERGRAFAFCIAASCFGTLMSTAVVTSVSMHDVNAQYQGWQMSFLVLGCLAVAFSLLLVWAGQSPEYRLPRPPGAPGSAWTDFVQTLSMPTFRVVLLQGAFVSTALEAHAFLIIWAQYIGYRNWVAGLLVSIGMLGTLCGCFFGGYLGDQYAVSDPDHGRVYVGQVGGSMMLIFWSIIMFMPHTTEYVIWLALVLFMFGFVKNWEYVAAIRPILVEVAPNRRRATVIGYAAAIDGVVSAMLGGPLIGFLSERVFGYQRTTLDVDAMPEEQRLANLEALSQSLGMVTSCCIVGNLLAFSILHITYKTDRHQAKLHDQ